MDDIAEMRDDVKNKITALDVEINEIEESIEDYRNSNTGDDDNLVVQELEEKRDMLETQKQELRLGMQDLNFSTNLKEYKVECKGQTKTLTLVHPTLADSSIGHISTDSPLAKALENKNIGDSFELETPTGKVEYKIISIK